MVRSNDATEPYSLPWSESGLSWSAQRLFGGLCSQTYLAVPHDELTAPLEGSSGSTGSTCGWPGVAALSAPGKSMQLNSWSNG